MILCVRAFPKLLELGSNIYRFLDAANLGEDYTLTATEHPSDTVSSISSVRPTPDWTADSVHPYTQG